jgi:hypothetical protein
MEIISNRISNENDQLPPPPPYATAIYKLDEADYNTIPPPAYSDVDAQSITYINNYPGPPLTDGQVQAIQNPPSNIQETRRTKNVRIHLMISGILTILFGIISIGIQIGILATNSIIYYYYGFWGGAIIISFGIGSILFQRRRYSIDYLKLFRSFFWQMVLIGIVFSIGIVIILTDKCDDDATENDGITQCRHSRKILNGFLLATFASAFVLSIINVIIFAIFKRFD